MHEPLGQPVDRRVFIRRGARLTVGAALAGSYAFTRADDPEKPVVRIGLVTDLHYADREPGGTRHYRETPRKLAEAITRFEHERVDLVVALGDAIDSAESLDVERGYLRRIATDLAAAPGAHHYVLGNHCVSALTKTEFLETVGQKESFYSFDTGGVHFVLLDACFRSDGEPYGRKNFEWTDANIPAAELEWLRADLEQTPHRTIVFVHQRLDVAPPLGIRNAPEVRKALEDSGKVLAVFQGHDHQGGYQRIADIHYVTLSALVEGSGPENNAYAVVDVLPGDVLRVTGYGKQRSHELRR